MSDSIPIRKIQKYLFCKRQYYLECILSIPADPTYELVHGELLHRRVDARRYRSKKRKLFGMSVEVGSKLGIHGIADLVEYSDSGNLIVVEFRRTGDNLHHADRVGLAAYALCLEEEGYGISHLEMFSFKTRRRSYIRYSNALRNQVISTVREIQTETRFPETNNPNKCTRCANRLICKGSTVSTQISGFMEGML